MTNIGSACASPPSTPAGGHVRKADLPTANELRAPTNSLTHFRVHDPRPHTNAKRELAKRGACGSARKVDARAPPNRCLGHLPFSRRSATSSINSRSGETGRSGLNTTTAMSAVIRMFQPTGREQVGKHPVPERRPTMLGQERAHTAGRDPVGARTVVCWSTVVRRRHIGPGWCGRVPCR
jgi:hypothetical protein